MRGAQNNYMRLLRTPALKYQPVVIGLRCWRLGDRVDFNYTQGNINSFRLANHGIVRAVDDASCLPSQPPLHPNFASWKYWVLLTLHKLQGAYSRCFQLLPGLQDV